MTDSIEIENVDYKDRVFSDNITAEREPSAGPGWYMQVMQGLHKKKC